MCINRLPLNRDVQDVIKSYALYDMKTAETLKKVKTQKKEIVNMFENAAVSRKNDGLQDFEQESELDSEHWVFWLGGNENQFQASNCSKCGNYSAEYAYDYMPQNILCSCGDDDDDYQYHPNQNDDDNDNDNDYDQDYQDNEYEPPDHYEYHEQYYNDSDLDSDSESVQISTKREISMMCEEQRNYYREHTKK